MTPNERAKGSRRGRARGLMRENLGWIGGFPLESTRPGGLEWMLVPRPRAGGDRVTLGPGNLARARRTVNVLVREHSRELHELAGGSERFRTEVELVCRLADAALRGTRPLPRSLLPIDGFSSSRLARNAGELCKRQRELAPLVDAFSWSCVGGTEGFESALAWTTREARWLAGLLEHTPGADGIALAIELWRLGLRDGSQRVSTLLHLLGDSRAHRYALEGGRAHAAKLVAAIGTAIKEERADAWPAAPAAVLGARLRDLARWAIHESPARSRRALHWLELALDTGLLADWQTFWQALDTAQQALQRLSRPHPKLLDRLGAVSASISEIQKLAPHDLSVKALSDALTTLAESETRGLAAALDALLELLPPRSGELLPRAALLVTIATRLAQSDAANRAALVRMLGELERYLSQTAKLEASSRLSPWQKELQAAAHPGRGGAFDELFEVLSNHAQRARFFAALTRIAPVAGEDLESAAETLLELSKLVGSDAHAAELALAGARHEISDSPRLLELALVASDGSAESFALLAKRLGECADRIGPGALAVARAFADRGAVEIVRELVESGETERLTKLGNYAELSSRLKLPDRISPPAPRDDGPEPSWARTLPRPIRRALRRLLSVSLDGESSAIAALGSVYSHPARVRRELADLDRLLAKGAIDPRVERRARNLRSRLERPLAVTAAKLARAEQKLVAAARRAVLDAVERDLTAALARAIPTKLGIEPAPGWLLDASMLELLPAILALDPPMRELGMRVLRERAGAPPWDLRDEPANARFVESLRARGLDPVPWLDGIGEVLHAGRDGRQARLRLEDDPLEMLRMGAHFETCLSPGQFNFFSVIANIVDVNKRVLYARDSDGRVVGRCLLALTRAGGIVTFHAYSHDQRWRFDDGVKAFVQKLAARMHTALLPEGAVPLLISPRWYDDGPEDLAGQFRVFDDDSVLRRSLAEIDLAVLVDALERALDPLPLNELTLPLVLGLPEVASRPALVLPLLPLLETVPELPAVTLVKALRFVCAAGARDRVSRTLVQRLHAQALRMQSARDWFDPEAPELLLKLDPSLTLRFLQRTRERGVREWRDEDEVDRLRIGAEAYAALGRPRRAIELFKLAARRAPESPMREQYRMRLHELKRGLRRTP